MRKIIHLCSILLFSTLIVGCSGNPPIECPPPPPPVECDSCCEECPECPACDSCCPEWECPEDWTCTPPDPGPSCGDLKGDHCSDQGECPEGYTSLGETWDCNPCCVEEEEPPPPIDADPDDYISTRKAEQIIEDVESDSRTPLYLGTWVSVRHPEYVGRWCPAESPAVLGKTSNQMYAMSYEGQRLMDRYARDFKNKLRGTNRRCSEYEEFCKVTDVRVNVWEPFAAEIVSHNMQISLANQAALADRASCSNKPAYDNMMGWCCKCKGNGPNCEEFR